MARDRNGFGHGLGHRHRRIGELTSRRRKGSLAGALGPIGDVYKGKVYELAHFINGKNRAKSLIPASTITKPPSAELRPNQKDQDSLPAYEVLDQILAGYLESGLSEQELIQKGFASETVKNILKLVQVSEFKRRQAAPVLKVSSKAFGIGRRIPITKSMY